MDEKIDFLLLYTEVTFLETLLIQLIFRKMGEKE